MSRAATPTVRDVPRTVALPVMSDHDPAPAITERPMLEKPATLVAQLLDIVAAHDLEHALSDMEHLITRLRADAQQAAAARTALRGTPAPLLREGLRLRAARHLPADSRMAPGTDSTTRRLQGVEPEPRRQSGTEAPR
jgi:hypothetical protein